MRLKLSNGFVRVTEGDIGAQFSENVRFAIDSDMDGYVPSLLVKFQNDSGDVVEALCQKDGDEFVIPSAAYRQTQVIMLTVSSAKGDEVVNSQPLYVRITEGNSGGAVILPTDEDTWKTAVKAYFDSLMVATNEKILQLAERLTEVEQNGGGTGGGSVSQKFSVTYNGEFAEWGSVPTEVNALSPLSLSFSVASGHNLKSVVVAMGGADVTDSVLSGQSISIPSVTGNVVISVYTASVSGGGFVQNLYDVNASTTNTGFAEGGYGYAQYGSNRTVCGKVAIPEGATTLYVRAWRKTKVNAVVDNSANFYVGVLDADGNHLDGSPLKVFTNVVTDYNINGLDTLGSDTIYCKGVGSATLPTGTKYIEVAYFTSSPIMQNDLKTKLFVTTERISDLESDEIGTPAEVVDDPSDFDNGVGATGGGSIIVDGGSSSKPLLGKTIAVIGDSLTDWGGGNNSADGFLKVVHNRTGASMSNLGLAGEKWEGTSDTCGVGRVNNIVNNGIVYDSVVFILGTNRSSEGSVSDSADTTTTMCGAIKYCLKSLMEYAPTMPILVCLPPQRAEGNSAQESANDKIKQICGTYGVDTLDLFHTAQIVPNSVAITATLSDGLHLNDNGKANLGRVLANKLVALI